MQERGMAKDILYAVGALGFLLGMVLVIFVRGSVPVSLMIILIAVVATSGAAVIDAIEKGIARLFPEKPEPVAALPLRVTPGFDVVEARLLLKRAEDLQFARNFGEAAVVYKSLLDGFPESRQAAAARQQLENLRNVR
jgi:hypothetical protein